MRGEPHIWFITTCMGRLSSLKRSLPTFSHQRNSRVVVVDYSCPDRAGAWVETHYPECRVVRVADAEFFHLSRARNAGFLAVSPDADWVCFVDADVCLSPSFYERVQPLLEPGRFVVLPMHPRNKGLTPVFLGDGLARHMDHGDELRSRHYRERDLVRSSIENSRKLRALIRQTETETGKEIPLELCYKERDRGVWGSLLVSLRDAALGFKRFWRLPRHRA